MADKLTRAELIAWMRLVRDEGSATKAAHKEGISVRAGALRSSQAKALDLTADSPIQDEADRLKIQVKALQKDITFLTKEADTAAAIRAQIYNLAARPPQPPAWLNPKTHKSSIRGCPMTIWSDWHYGETVRPEEVGGYNEFNSEIAAQRITKLVDTTIELCFEHMGRAEASYPGVVVMLGGDMISGDIHEELLANNDRTTQQCINELTDLLAGALTRMADAFGRVFVPCVVGNHGRSTKKPRMKGRVYTSHEWNIYCNLERHFRALKDTRLQFFIAEDTDAYFTVFGHRFLLTHGDSLGVKGGDGIIGAIGPIMRGTLKASKSEATIGRDFDTLVMGHWHQPLWLPNAIVNGALKGYDEFARIAMRAPYSPPSQSLWFVHPTHGITAKWEVFLEKRIGKAKPAADEWLSWKTT